STSTAPHRRRPAVSWVSLPSSARRSSNDPAPGLNRRAATPGTVRPHPARAVGTGRGAVRGRADCAPKGQELAVTMIKTYGRDGDGVLHYLEGWTDQGSFVTHRGKVGSVGTNTRRAIKRANRPSSPSLDEHVAGLRARAAELGYREIDRKSTRLNSSHVSISYAVFCLK